MQKFLKLIVRFTIWGAILGTLEGILLFYFYSLAYYGIFGILFNTLAGGVLGLINGVALYRVLFYPTEENPAQRRQIMLATSALLSIISSIILYSLMYYPLARSIQGVLILIIPPVAIATLIAIYASQRVFKTLSLT